MTVYQDFGYEVVVMPQATVAARADFLANALEAEGEARRTGSEQS